MMGQEDVDLDNRINGISRQLQQLTWSPLLVRGLAADCPGLDCAGQFKLLLQAQALLTKNLLYQNLDSCLHRLASCTAAVYGFLPRSVDVASAGSGGTGEVVTAAQRDAAVTHLRFLNIFCNLRHDTLAHAVQLLDLVLGRVKVHPKFLSSISTCCLYIAAKANEPPVLTSSLRDMLVLGQSGGSLADLMYTERLIVELLGTEVMEAASTCNPLVFLRMFHNIMLVDFADNGCIQALDLSLLVSKLEVIICHFDFTRFHADLLSLALLSYSVQQAFSDCTDLLPIAELQYYCQMNDATFMECCEMIANCLSLYQKQPTRTPRLHLSWSVSRRTLHKMRPSTRAAQDLEPIMEDESLRTSFSNDENDSSAFDSEVDDGSSADNKVITFSGADDDDDDDETADDAENVET